MTQGKRIQVWQFVILAIILTCGALVVGVCVAKMVSNDEADIASRQVARWSVSAESDEDEVLLTAGGEEKVLNVTVTNDSEVANTYTISVSGIPDGILVGIDQDDLKMPVDGIVEFTNENYELDIQDHKSETHALRFAATLTDDAADISEEDITVDVTFTQKDPQS